MPKQFTCPHADCPFQVRTATEYEAFDAAERHAEDKHGEHLTGTELSRHVTDV